MQESPLPTTEADRTTQRRRFLGLGLTASAAVGLASLPAPAFAAGGLSKGDEAILRFLAAAELIETDLWQQYNELAGIQDREVPGGSGNPAYTEAVEVLDEDMAQYIHDNTDDEISHAAFINAYLKANGGKPVDLDRFRTLPSSKATGARQIGRLTNLMQLTVDTSFWTRYRSDSQNPDLGDTFPQRRPGTGRRGSFRRSRAATPTSARPSTCRRSPTRPASTSASSSRAARASTPSSPSGSPTSRCCASCSASARPRRCTSRPGTTRPATRRRSPTRRTVSCSRT